MQRAALLTIVPALAAGALAPAAHAAAPARAVLVSCDRVGRAATFDGRMAAVPAATRMQMRFSLQDRMPHTRRFRTVRIPGFRAWQTAAPGRTRYVYTKRVEGLVGPAAYRVVVDFRWLDADGVVRSAARATSHGCWQPDPRADLSVGSVAVGPGLTPDRARYAVTVLNSGRSAAGDSRLALDLGDGGAPLTAAVGPLAAGAETTVILPGRACVPGATLTATADATDVVDEHDEDDDVLVTTCPPG